MPYATIEDGICEQCGKPFTYHWRAEGRRFCSQSCYHADKRKDRIVRTCEQCGTSFEVLASRIQYGARYCSEACAARAKRIPATDRYWIKVNKNGPVPEHRPDLGPCWLWIAGKDESGYGTFWFMGLKQRAHRVAWQLVNGPVPDDKDVCHACDNPSCVNVAHLFLGTVSDNMRDAIAKGRKERVPPVAFKPGESHVNAILTEDDVREVRRLTGEGWNQRRIAEHLGVSRSTIHDVQYERTWTHVR